MTKYCNVCGTANDDEGKFCVSCGSKLESSIENAVNPAMPSSAQSPSGGDYQIQQQPQYPAPASVSQPAYPPQGQYPQGQYPPPSQIPASGATPQGQYPTQAQYPQGQYPPAQYPGQYPPAQYPAQGQYPAPVATAGPVSGEKSEFVAFILSFFLPGFGHIYAGKTGTGILLFIIFWITIFTIIIPFFIWILGMIDSVSKVKSYNRFLRMYGRPPNNYEY